MTALKKIVTLILLLANTFLSCNNSTEKENKTSVDTGIDYTRNEPRILSDSIDYNTYNVIVMPDTSSCKGFKNGRVITRILKQKKTVLQELERESDIIYLRTIDSINLWVCNLPKEFTKKNIGDTIVVSAYVYNIFGDEKVWGEPTVLTEIFLPKFMSLQIAGK